MQNKKQSSRGFSVTVHLRVIRRLVIAEVSNLNLSWVEFRLSKDTDVTKFEGGVTYEATPRYGNWYIHRYRISQSFCVCQMWNGCLGGAAVGRRTSDPIPGPGVIRHLDQLSLPSLRGR